MGMDLLEYHMRIEDAFNIRIPDEDATGLLTVGQMHEYLSRRLPTLDTEQVWHRQLDVLCRFRRLDAARRAAIKASDGFVRDLNFD
jgi:hypothetical protein